MKYSDQAGKALSSLPPGVKRDVRAALRDLGEGKHRDTKALTGQLEGFFRLRVGRWRIIYRFSHSNGEIIIEFIKDRGTVYDEFSP